MTAKRYTLVTDGSSDRILLPILDWLWREVYRVGAKGEWFDPRPFGPPSLSLQDRIRRAIDLYPCDTLFVHRDAESDTPEERYEEISQAIEAIREVVMDIPHVCVVPVRMTEAWLLFDESAIRRAAGNPNGKMILDLPLLPATEQCPNPKNLIFDAIQKASGLNKRRLKKLNVRECRARLAELIRDYSPLRQLPAFSRLEQDLGEIAKSFCL